MLQEFISRGAGAIFRWRYLNQLENKNRCFIHFHCQRRLQVLGKKHGRNLYDENAIFLLKQDSLDWNDKFSCKRW